MTRTTVRCPTTEVVVITDGNFAVYADIAEKAWTAQRQEVFIEVFKDLADPHPARFGPYLFRDAVDRADRAVQAKGPIAETLVKMKTYRHAAQAPSCYAGL